MTGSKNTTKYNELIFKQYQELMVKYDKLYDKVVALEKENKLLKVKLDKANKKIEKLTNENQKLREENKILREENKMLKNKIANLEARINKDSSNSSKPSSTNGYKKVITNRREKSDKNKGGQPGHHFFSLNKDKVKELKENGAIVEIYDVDKTMDNCNKEYKTITKIDIKIVPIIKEYRYYPNEEGKYNIPSNLIQDIEYGSNVKALVTSLVCAYPNSMDSASSIISSITNGMINISKGTINNWVEKLGKKLEPELEKIEESLLDSYYINADESNIKVNGENSNVLCVSNKTHTRLWTSKKKTSKALEEIGFMPKFNNIIVKDGTKIYNQYGSRFSQCVSHILRYTKGIVEGNKREEARNMIDYISQILEEREGLIGHGVTAFSKERYMEIKDKINSLFKDWKNAWFRQKRVLNPMYKEEKNLLQRYEEEENEIFYFLKDFKVPATNNQAESDQRPVKIKQKIGKPRSENGAKIYCDIRSCINTYKKNDINVYGALADAYDNKPIII